MVVRFQWILMQADFLIIVISFILMNLGIILAK
jgi:hypothetical protein